MLSYCISVWIWTSHRIPLSFTKCDVVCKIFQNRLGSKPTLTGLVVITMYQLSLMAPLRSNDLAHQLIIGVVNDLLRLQLKSNFPNQCGLITNWILISKHMSRIYPKMCIFAFNAVVCSIFNESLQVTWDEKTNESRYLVGYLIGGFRP